MRWVAFRKRAVTTRVGEAQLTRAYWHCPACGTGCAPDDELWDLPPGNTSWGVRDGASLLGALLPSFAKIAYLLETLTLFQVSARSTETWTEAVGTVYAPPVLAPDDPGPAPDLVIIEADAGMTLWRTDNAWHEEKVFAAWCREHGVDQPLRYAVAQGPWADQEALLYDLARRVGVRQAPEVLCLADGASAIWRLFTRCFPDAFQLLDWYHLMTHLGLVAAAHPDGAAWLAVQQEALRFRGPRETLLALKALHQRGATPELREQAGACLIYMWHHRRRMDYPEARRRGYPIGSGRMESGVKQVVQARAKQAGMRWNPLHMHLILRARCAALSGDWALACAQTKAATKPAPLLLPRAASTTERPSRHPTAEPPAPRALRLGTMRQMGQAVKKAFGF